MGKDAEEVKKLKNILNELVNLYIANKGKTDSEFIKCVTPPHSMGLSPLERRKDKYWAAWDKARILLGE